MNIKRALRAVKRSLNDRAVIVATGLIFLLTLALVIQLVVGGIAFFVGYTDSIVEPFAVGLGLILTVWAACIAKTVACVVNVNKGGAAIAENLGAKQASAKSHREDEKALIQVVAKTAIAFGYELPSVHVLREETSINSLVVGSLSGETALIVTKGALNALNEDEQLGMVAHEFAHIANKDVPRNMQLMMAFSGLLALDQYGRQFIQQYSKAAFIHPLRAIGYVLMGLGLVGVLFASALRRIYTKRSEVRADKTAIYRLQRTEPLYAALSKVACCEGSDAALHAHYVDVVRHLCFHPGNEKLWRTKFNSSHPSLQARLRYIDPENASLETPDIAIPESNAPKANKVSSRKINTPSLDVSEAANEVARTLGLLVEEPKIPAISDKLSMTVKDPVSALAAMYALFLPADADKRLNYLSAVAFSYNQNLADTIVHVHTVLNNEFEFDRYRVGAQVASQLRKNLAPESSRQILLNVERLLKAHGLHNLMNYSAVQYLRHELKADFPVLTQLSGKRPSDAQGRKLTPLNKMGQELACLLSQVVASAEISAESKASEFSRIMTSYSIDELAHYDEEDSVDVHDTEAAYQLLLMQPQAVRDTFIQHCRDIFSLSRSHIEQKHSQLELLCASLGCSIMQSQRWNESDSLRKIA